LVSLAACIYLPCPSVRENRMQRRSTQGPDTHTGHPQTIPVAILQPGPAPHEHEALDSAAVLTPLADVGPGASDSGSASNAWDMVAWTLRTALEHRGQISQGSQVLQGVHGLLAGDGHALATALEELLGVLARALLQLVQLREIVAPLLEPCGVADRAD